METVDQEGNTMTFNLSHCLFEEGSTEEYIIHVHQINNSKICTLRVVINNYLQYSVGKREIHNEIRFL